MCARRHSGQDIDEHDARIGLNTAPFRVIAAFEVKNATWWLQACCRSSKGRKIAEADHPDYRPNEYQSGKCARSTELAEAKARGRMPLEYLLAVMNDCTADEYRRDRMAIAAAPYVHARAGDVKPGNESNSRRVSKTLPAI